jgi:hypothetical protein
MPFLLSAAAINLCQSFKPLSNVGTDNQTRLYHNFVNSDAGEIAPDIP